jgi:glycosyltransferase involved in cell wall biosynthesis
VQPGLPAEPREPCTSRDRRHLCVVTETYPPEINGVATTLGHLVAGMRARGHQVSLVRPRQRGDDAPGSGPDRATTLVGGARLPGYRGLQIGLPSGASIIAAWSRHRPDAAYVATEGPLGWSALRAGAALGIPVYSGFHTNFHRYAGHYRAGWLRSVISAYLRRFHNATAGTFVSTLRLRDELATAGFRNLSVLGRGVDSRRFNPAGRSTALRSAWGASDHDLVILYVGRLAPEKNVGLAIDAYRAMRAVNRHLRFVVVGDGPLRPTLQRDHPDLVFRGFRTGDDLAAHYASADVFLFPSETETFGNVTLEAMASGLAVIAYDYAAARVHVEHGTSGLLVPLGDRRGFLAAAENLARVPALLPAMRRRARAAMEAVEWTHVVERFERLLSGAAHREEKDSAEQLDVARPGTRPRPRGGVPDPEAREGALHPSRPVVDPPPAAAAVASGPGISLHRRPVLPG